MDCDAGSHAQQKRYCQTAVSCDPGAKSGPLAPLTSTISGTIAAEARSIPGTGPGQAVGRTVQWWPIAGCC
jgi:hypothetical protein